MFGLEFYALAAQCAPSVEPQVTAGVVRTESSFNPFAIGVVGGAIKQPRNLREAQAAVRKLQAQGKNFSVGLSQVNKINFKAYGLNINNMFDPCTNLRAGSKIFKTCFDRADRKYGNKYSYDGKIRLAASCYYSGNFRTGFKVDFKGQPPYVDKVYNNIQYFRRKGQPLPQQNGYELPKSSKGLADFATQVNNTSQFSKPSLANKSSNEKIALVSTDSTSSPEQPQKGKLNNSGDVFASPVLDVFNLGVS